MKKLIVIFLGLLLVGCGRWTSNLSNDPKYRPLIGKEFKIIETYAVITYQDNKKELVVHEFDTQEVPKAEVIGNKYPYEYYGNIIHGVLNSGTIFKITRIEKESTIEGSTMGCKAEIISEGQFKGKIIDVSLLTNLEEDNFKFDSKYAVEVTK